MKLKVKGKSLFDDRRYFKTEWRGKEVWQDIKTTNIYFVNLVKYNASLNKYEIPYIFKDTKLKEDVSYWTKESIERNFGAEVLNS